VHVLAARAVLGLERHELRDLPARAHSAPAPTPTHTKHALLEAPALDAQRANLVEQHLHLARERLGEVVDIPAAQSWCGAGMRARAHFGAPPLYALVVARGRLASGDLPDMAQ
jgi:hypothetical protein